MNELLQSVGQQIGQKFKEVFVREIGLKSFGPRGASIFWN